VRDAPREAPDCFHLLRLPELPFALRQRLFSPFSLPALIAFAQGALHRGNQPAQPLL